MIISDVAVLPERVKRELIRGENARAEFAIRAQTALQEAMGEMGPRRHIEGIGQHKACIHPDLAARIRVKFPNCSFNDPDFLRSLLQANPFLRVQSVPKKLAIRVDGLRDEEKGKRPTPNAERPMSNGEGRKDFQNGKGHGGAGEPRTPSNCREDQGSSLLVSLGQGSGHETPARSDLAGPPTPGLRREEAHA